MNGDVACDRAARLVEILIERRTVRGNVRHRARVKQVADLDTRALRQCRRNDGGLGAAFDAERVFELPGLRVADPKSCQCGEVLKGVLKPWECKVFGTACTPETPIGTCMVSPEGACAAYYNLGRFSRQRVREASRA